jgi:TatA/E family protein of Tat protein translocase
MPFNIQGPELIILLVIALLVLGPGKLPEVGSALGKSLREFRKAASDVKEATSIEPTKATAPIEPPRVSAPPVAPPSTVPAEPVAAAPSATGTDTPAS